MRELWSLVRGLPIIQQPIPPQPAPPPVQPKRFATAEETLAFFSE